jgi:hypothetical protein
MVMYDIYDISIGDGLADICRDLFESVYNVDTCDLDTKDVSDPSDGCVSSRIRLHKGPENDGVPLYFVKLCANGLKSPLLHPSSFLF